MEQIPMTATSLQQRSQPVLLPSASDDHRTERSLSAPLTTRLNSPSRCGVQQKNKIPPRAARRKSRFRIQSHVYASCPHERRSEGKRNAANSFCSSAVRHPSRLQPSYVPPPRRCPTLHGTPSRGSFIAPVGQRYGGEVPATARRCLQVKSVLRTMSDSTAHRAKRVLERVWGIQTFFAQTML